MPPPPPRSLPLLSSPTRQAGRRAAFRAQEATAFDRDARRGDDAGRRPPRIMPRRCRAKRVRPPAGAPIVPRDRAGDSGVGQYRTARNPVHGHGARGRRRVWTARRAGLSRKNRRGALRDPRRRRWEDEAPGADNSVRSWSWDSPLTPSRGSSSSSQSAKGQRRAGAVLAAICSSQQLDGFNSGGRRSCPAVPYHTIHACLWIGVATISTARMNDVDMPSSRGASFLCWGDREYRCFECVPARF
jgi:hypothetical protein